MPNNNGLYNPLPPRKEISLTSIRAWKATHQYTANMYCQTDSLSRQKQCHLRKKVILMKLEFRSGRLVIDVRTVFVIQSISVSICRDSPWTSIQTWPLAPPEDDHHVKPPCKTVVAHITIWTVTVFFLYYHFVFASPHTNGRKQKNCLGNKLAVVG